MTSIFRNTIVTVIGHRNINSFKAFTLKTMVIICYISMLVYISLSFECKSSGAIEITILWSYELQSQTRWRPQWWTCTTSSWVMWTASAKASNHVSLHSFYFGMFHRRDQKTQSLTTIKVGIVFTVWLWNNGIKVLDSNVPVAAPTCWQLVWTDNIVWNCYPREKCKMECTGKISLCVTVMQQAENKMVCGVGPQFPSARRWHNGEHLH